MNLLFPGRQSVNTTFQEEYLRSVLHRPLNELEFIGERSDFPKGASIDNLVIAITSSNRHNSRYNSVPYDKRIVSVDRFAQQFRESGLKVRIVGVPDFGITEKFPQLLTKHVLEETDHGVNLTTENTVVVCSTPSVIPLYRKHGFAVLPAELASLSPERYHANRPVDLVRRIAEAGDWANDDVLRRELSQSTQSMFRDFPEVPARIASIFNDPLLTEEGILTLGRDRDIYLASMGRREVVELKHADIKDAIRDGKIIDHVCADGGLIELFTRSHPDSDFYGMDADGENIERAKDRQRQGRFRDVFTYFRHGNIATPFFSGPVADTIICVSLLHEIWSYGRQEQSIADYLNSVHSQLVAGGRFVARDVVAPEDKEKEVWMWLNDKDGSNQDVYASFDDTKALAQHLHGLSTRSRFLRFAEDFLAGMRSSGRRSAETKIRYRIERADGIDGVALRLKDAAEFMLTKDYTANWGNEMNEEFTFFSLSEWKNVLSRAGFAVLESHNEPQLGSRAYTNPWISGNWWNGKVQLYEKSNGGLQPISIPTTMVLVGEKR